MDSTNTENTYQKSNNHPDTWKCAFGRYKGQTYKYICMTDPDYAKWLITILKSQAAKNYMMSLLV